MSGTVNDIQLNGILIENLYRRSLVELHDGSPAVPIVPEIKYLGNNARNITILVNDPGNTFMPEGHLAFLTKILGACKLNIGDVAIVNTAHTTDIVNIVDTLQPSRIIAFGTDMEFVGIDQVKAYAIGEMLPETSESKAKKAKLWAELKSMLGL